MSPGVQFGGTSLIIAGVVSGIFSAIFFPRDYAELVACSLTGLAALVLAIKMNRLRRNPGVKFKFQFFGVGEILKPSDRDHLFWLYLVVGLLFSLGSLYGAIQLYVQ